ncbi:unnamed protein product [Amoebophrya sp. A120]|nr:unnamed protein product [Amoebophrya sp. A120]|eukprot:GSA120T00014723001.1
MEARVPFSSSLRLLKLKKENYSYTMDLHKDALCFASFGRHIHIHTLYQQTPALYNCIPRRAGKCWLLFRFVLKNELLPALVLAVDAAATLEITVGFATIEPRRSRARGGHYPSQETVRAQASFSG